MNQSVEVNETQIDPIVPIVDEFCTTPIKAFNPTTDLPKAKAIIDSLDRLQVYGTLIIIEETDSQYGSPGGAKGKRYDPQKDKRLTLGKWEARKVKLGRNPTIVLEANEVLQMATPVGEGKPITTITYDKKSYEPISITRMTPKHMKRLAAVTGFRVGLYDTIKLWHK